MTIEHKSMSLQDFKSDAHRGSFTGYCSVFETLDRQGEIVSRGAFRRHLSDFLKSGFLAFNHDWAAPIGYIKSATEDQTGLLVECAFHSHARAQEVRQVVRERLEAGKDVQMSIGYQVERDSRDQKSGARRLDEIRILEASVVAAAANPRAMVASVKHLGLKEGTMSNNLALAYGYGGRTSGEAFTLSPQYKQSGARGRYRVETPNFKFVDVPPAAGWGGVAHLPTRRVYVIELIPEVSVTESMINYSIETEFGSEMTAVAAGALKPEVSLGYQSQVAPVEVIAGWLRATREALEDTPQLRQIIDSRLSRMVALAEERQIVSGDGTSPNLLGILSTPGIQTDTTIPGGIGKIRAVEATPTAVVINPADWEAQRAAAAAAGGYTVSPIDGTERLYGVLAVITKAVPAGTSLVGDFAQGAVIFRRSGAAVTIGTQGDDITTNRVTLLGESRIAFATTIPVVFCEVTLA